MSVVVHLNRVGLLRYLVASQIGGDRQVVCYGWCYGWRQNCLSGFLHPTKTKTKRSKKSFSLFRLQDMPPPLLHMRSFSSFFSLPPPPLSLFLFLSLLPYILCSSQGHEGNLNNTPSSPSTSKRKKRLIAANHLTITHTSNDHYPRGFEAKQSIADNLSVTTYLASS